LVRIVALTSADGCRINLKVAAVAVVLATEIVEMTASLAEATV
jgi:hypothetical protein